MSDKKVIKEYELTCKPLNTYEEILLFLEDPPAWRSLCKEISPHGKSLIRNIDIHKHYESRSIEAPKTFCHFDPDAEEVQRYDGKKLPKTLVCHDMANGYHDDSIIDGTNNCGAYTFYNWAGIDIFCYFSHHLITIPPVGWINVAHAHGVKVIGTIITEWADGILFWDKILASDSEYQTFASALVAIAKTFKFDGWLLNIENKISKPDVLLDFVRFLHSTLHREVVGAELIWYDSVTINGNLHWQNALNNKNMAFFEACDSLFTNYSWSEWNVAESAVAAGDRLTDIYIGIDVWGRNFYGGGKFNTQAAVKIARDYGCSLAIFAPAWTHEAMGEDKCDVTSVSTTETVGKYEKFLLRDRALWGSIWHLLNTRVPCLLPFQSSFCRGQGLKRRLYGEVLGPSPWYNIRHMQYQPNSAHGPHGYLLSTEDWIQNISKNAINKDDPGFLKYWKSFSETRIQLHSVKSQDNIIEAIDNLIEFESDNEDDAEEAENLSKKFKNSFKDMFEVNQKKRKTENGGNINDAGTGAVPGNSIVEVPDNLKVEKVQYALVRVPEERECLEVYFRDSFIGGSCLKINPSDAMCPEHRLTRLFNCEFTCNEMLVACLVTKCLSDFQDQYLNVQLFMKTAQDEDLKVVLVGRSLPEADSSDGKRREVIVYPVNETSDNSFKELQKYLLVNIPSFYVPVENAYDWIVRYYVIEAPGSRVTSVNLRTGLEQEPILLGYFGLCEKTQKSD